MNNYIYFLLIVLIVAVGAPRTLINIFHWKVYKAKIKFEPHLTPLYDPNRYVIGDVTNLETHLVNNLYYKADQFLGF